MFLVKLFYNEFIFQTSCLTYEIHIILNYEGIFSKNFNVQYLKTEKMLHLVLFM